MTAPQVDRVPEFAPNGQPIPSHVHPREGCSGACPFHNPSAHTMASWPFLVRLSALVERTCRHGVGHPDPDSMRWMNERTGQACETFTAATRGLRRAPQGRSVSVPATDYDGVVERLLDKLALRADRIAATVGGFRDAEGAVDAVALARIERERSAAMERYRRDRDAAALDRTMAALDRQEATARIDAPTLTPAEVRDYLVNLPELWRDAPTTRGRLVGSLWDSIGATGTDSLDLHWSPESIALGIADGMPVTATVSVGSGRGERDSPSLTHVSRRPSFVLVNRTRGATPLPRVAAAWTA